MPGTPSSRRIVFLQFGDYAEAVHRFAAGGKENYYAQKYTVDFVAALASRFSAVTVITLSRDATFEKLPNGVGGQGLLLFPPGKAPREAELIRVLEGLDPTDLIVCAPVPSILKWGLRRGIQVLPLLADSFLAPGLKNRLRHFLLARLLNRRGIRWVANHSIAASLDLARIGVDRRKVLPFDWPPVVSPAAYAAKEPPAASPFRLIYVGLLLHAKGVGDTLRAMTRLPSCTLTIVGAGAQEAELRAIPAAEGTAGRISFRGKIPHDEVLAEMRAHDAVLVPSRHEYAEGLPMTIYEALCTRTPVIASDHPMFLKRIVPDRNGLVFRAGDPAALAEAAERLRTSPDLYRSLSAAAGPSAESYLLPLKWQMLLDLWLDGGPAADSTLGSFSLASRTYV